MRHWSLSSKLQSTSFVSFGSDFYDFSSFSDRKKCLQRRWPQVVDSSCWSFFVKKTTKTNGGDWELYMICLAFFWKPQVSQPWGKNRPRRRWAWRQLGDGTSPSCWWRRLPLVRRSFRNGSTMGQIFWSMLDNIYIYTWVPCILSKACCRIWFVSQSLSAWCSSVAYACLNMGTPFQMSVCGPICGPVSVGVICSNYRRLLRIFEAKTARTSTTVRLGSFRISTPSSVAIWPGTLRNNYVEQTTNSLCWIWEPCYGSQFCLTNWYAWGCSATQQFRIIFWDGKKKSLWDWGWISVAVPECGKGLWQSKRPGSLTFSTWLQAPNEKRGQVIFISNSLMQF